MRRLALHVILIALALVSCAPFFWLICATLKRPEDFFVYAFLPWRHPERWTLSNYSDLFRLYPYGNWLVNSLFLASAQTALGVALSTLGGFALAKYDFRFKRPLTGLMLVTMLLPYQVLLPSLRLMTYRLGWTDTYAAVLLPGLASAFGCLLFMQAMRRVPDELLHAARVDGCSELRLWWDVALPVVRPMIGAYTLLSFMANWNAYLWPQIVLRDEAKYTLPVGLANMTGLPEFATPYGALMAGTLLSVLPVAVLFFVLQRDFIAGLASGAVKG